MLKRLLGVLVSVGVLLAVGVGQALAGFGGTSVNCQADSGALQPAIDLASAGDTLRIRGTCVGTFVVAKDLTLAGQPSWWGPKPTLDAEQAGTVLTVNGADTEVVVRKLTIRNGLAGDATGGGGVLNNGNLRVERSVLRDNIANTNAGGAIFNSGVLTVVYSVLRNNSARPSGKFSGGAIRNDGTATIRYSTLVGNSADDFAGGAIFNQGPMVIMKSKLIRNTAGDTGGGAIFNTGSGGPLEIASSYLVSNSADGGLAAGAIRANSGNVTVHRSKLKGYSASNGAGAISLGSGTFTLNRTTVIKNTADSGAGGIFVDGGTLNANRSLVALNRGTEAGGIFRPGGGTVNLNASAVVFNQPNNCVGFAAPGCV